MLQFALEFQYRPISTPKVLDVNYSFVDPPTGSKGQQKIQPTQFYSTNAFFIAVWFRRETPKGADGWTQLCALCVCCYTKKEHLSFSNKFKHFRLVPWEVFIFLFSHLQDFEACLKLKPVFKILFEIYKTKLYFHSKNGNKKDWLILQSFSGNQKFCCKQGTFPPRYPFKNPSGFIVPVASNGDRCSIFFQLTFQLTFIEVL